MAPHSSTLAWKTPWTEEPGGLRRWGLDTTERLHFPFSVSCIGEGNGNPLQWSCLENPRDGGAWWAAVYGVAQSRTWLKRFSSSSNMRETVRRGWGDLSEPRLEGWQRAWARVTWRWERYTTSDRNGFGIWKQRKGKWDQDRLNHGQTVSLQDEAGDSYRALSLTEGCGATARRQAFVPRTNESQWRSERQDVKKNLPSDLALFIEVI